MRYLIEVGKFPSSMKLPNLASVYKKIVGQTKAIIDLSVYYLIYQKVFERCVYRQMPNFFDEILSKYQCNFWGEHGSQHSLIALLEK